MSVPSITIIVLTFQRDDILSRQALSLEKLYCNHPIFKVILVDNNADERDRTAFFGTCSYECQVVPTDKNLGVAGGRNIGIRAANSDILVFLDDDAIVEPGFSLDKIVKYFKQKPELGAIAFKSINPFTGQIDNFEFPHTRKKWKSRKQPFDTFRFIGVGHALRSSALEQTGLYDDSFFYGMEEFDLSYRLVNHGYKILYDPEFGLHHHRHTSGRLDPSEKWQKSYTNKLKVAYKNLPIKYYFCVAIIWFVFLVYKTRSVAVPVRSVRQYFQWKKSSQPIRSPVNWRAIAYIKSCGGNIFV